MAVVPLSAPASRPEPAPGWQKGYAFTGPAFTDAKYFGDGIGIAVRKGDKENLERINAAIAAIRANGKYKEIEKKYFNFDIYGPEAK